ncbi:hypothetical protein F4814DRAFT_112163 [Daldinia grandis]|nr:hypothetical protein F4814DRAFT_112163 [Daldinia grandis]
MASNTSHTTPTEPYIQIRMKMPYGVASLGCPWCSLIWFKRIGDLQNHLSNVHDGMLRQAGINLTLQANTSNSNPNAINPPRVNSTSFQPGNMGALPGRNPNTSTPVPGSSQNPAFPIGSNPVALRSPRFNPNVPPQFPAQPQFSFQAQQSIPATQPMPIATPGSSPPPPSYCVQRQGQPPNGAFQLNSRTPSTVNGGIVPPFIPPSASNNYQKDTPIEELLNFGQWMA